MTEVLPRVLVVAFLATALVAVAIIMRKVMRGPGLTTLFAPKSQKRIDVIEQTPIDAKRRLVLVRRDGVEHLLMIGGPVDIVIEGGIGAEAVRGEPKPRASTPQTTLPPIGIAAE
jgi:flagellar biogenesis protein FliO